jgi:hypothetical protein
MLTGNSCVLAETGVSFLSSTCGTYSVIKQVFGIITGSSRQLQPHLAAAGLVSEHSQAVVRPKWHSSLFHTILLRHAIMLCPAGQLVQLPEAEAAC